LRLEEALEEAVATCIWDERLRFGMNQKINAIQQKSREINSDQ
jgi:hypothetical protein